MRIVNLAKIHDEDFAQLEKELVELNTLGKVLDWAGSKTGSECIPQIVAEIIEQDEYTQDVIIPFRELFLVFDST